MPDPLLPPPAPPSPPAPRPAADDDRRRVVCEFCECTLTRRGEVLEMGDKARRYRDHKDDHERELKAVNDALAAVARERDELKAKHAELTARATSRGPSIFSR